MTGGGGGRRSALPGRRGGGVLLEAVGRFGCSAGGKVEEIKGLVDCCSSAVGGVDIEACVGMEEDPRGVCSSNPEEGDGKLCSSDSEDMEASSAEEEEQLIGAVSGEPLAVCMGLDGGVHGGAGVTLKVGAGYLLHSELPRQFLNEQVGQGGVAVLGGSTCGGVAGTHGGGSARQGMEKGVGIGAGTHGVRRDDTCMGGVQDIASESFPSLGGRGDAQNASASMPRPSRGAWGRPAVIPLPVVGQSVEVKDGVDRVRLELEEVNATVKLFEFALVGRLFGKHIPFSFLNAELHRRWQGFGPFRLITVSSECFICIFEALESRDAVLMGGPWIVAGQVLGVDCWSPGFSPSSKVGSVTPVWVRLPGLPLYCWGGKSLARIAGGLGEPIWMDAATDRIERGLYARVCIRVDLSRALKPGVWVDGPYGSFFQPVEYEGLPLFCFMCGHVGHKALNCREGGVRLREHEVGKEKTSPVGGERSAGGGDLDVARGDLGGSEKVEAVRHAALELDKEGDEAEVAKGYGPWMLVQKKKRPSNAHRRGATKGKGIDQFVSKPSGGRHNLGKAQVKGQAVGSPLGAPSQGNAASSAWVQRGWPSGKDGWLERKAADLGGVSSLPFGESQVDLGKIGLKPFSGFKARSEVASLGPILDEDRRKRKKSSSDGGETSPMVPQ